MPKRLSYEEVKLSFENRGLTLLETEYKNNSALMLCMDAEGYKALISYDAIQSGQYPCFYIKNNPYTIENIQLFLDKRGEGTKILSKNYSNSKGMLQFLCSCGEIFENSWVNEKYNTHNLCKKCRSKLKGDQKRLPFEQVKQKFEENNLILLEEDYKRNYDPLLCMDNQGYIGYLAYNHLCGGKKFSKFSRSAKAEILIYNLNNWAKIKGVTSTVEGTYFNKHKNRVLIKCRCECGNSFETTINSFRHTKNRCNYCANSVSRYELLVQKWLKEKEINFVSQYRIKECKDSAALPFDFYLPDYNLLIETDGEGHYFPANFNQCSNESALISFQNIQKHDKIKNDYCKEHNRKLIRIPYWEFDDDNYKNILTNIIQN